MPTHSLFSELLQLCTYDNEVIAKPHFVLVFSLIFFDFHIMLNSFAIGSMKYVFSQWERKVLEDVCVYTECEI